MSMIEIDRKTYRDRSKWTPDSHLEWTDEPDKVQWKDPHTGLDCLAVRGDSGAWCGYVGLKKDRIGYGDDYDSECFSDVHVHGGLTFSEFCQEDNREEGVCHIADEKEDKAWWVGFDCAHGGDVRPAYGDSDWHKIPWLGVMPTYKDLEYVKSEIKNLALQLSKLGDNDES